ncbi:MAG: M16 family metallopeptidase, partial [Acidobacteriota bacterium]
VGDCSPEQVKKTIERFYEGMSRGADPPPVIPVEDPQQGERRAIQHRTVEAGALLAGFHVPALNHPDAVPLLALSTLLTEGESSRLYRGLVQNGHAGVVHSALGLSFLNRDPTLFRLDLIANPGDPLHRIESELWEEIDRIHQDGIQASEVRRATKQLQANLVLEARTCFYRGLQLGLYQVRAGDWRFVNRLMDGFGKLTADDITRVARTYLVPANRTVVTVLPEKK